MIADLERARLQPRRLRLHDLHRQQRAAARAGREGDRERRPGRRRRCCPATATSRAASTRWRAPTTSRRRRWSSPTRSPARWTSTPRREPLGTDTHGKPVFLRDIWPTPAEMNDGAASAVVGRALPRGVRAASSTATRTGSSMPVPTGDRLRVGRDVDLHQAAAVLRRHDARAGAVRTSAARACWRCSATRSPPTTSRPPGSIKAGQPGRPVPRSRTACSRRTSTPTARGAATTR